MITVGWPRWRCILFYRPFELPRPPPYNGNLSPWRRARWIEAATASSYDLPAGAWGGPPISIIGWSHYKSRWSKENLNSMRKKNISYILNRLGSISIENLTATFSY